MPFCRSIKYLLFMAISTPLAAIAQIPGGDWEGPPPSVPAAQKAPSKEDACVDLNKEICKPDDFDDGTGTVRRQKRQDFIQNMKKEMEAKQTQEFRKILARKDPDSIHLRDLFGSLLVNAEKSGRLSGGAKKSCGEKLESAGSPGCIDALSSYAAHLTLLQVFPIGRPSLARPEKATFTIGSSELSDEDQILADPEFRKRVSEMNKDVRSRITAPEAAKKVTDEYLPKMRRIVRAKLEKMYDDPATKAYILEKFDAINLDSTNCSELYGSSESVTAVLAPNAVYFNNSDTFKVCNGLLFLNNSEFPVLHAIAHELAHSFDPCNVAHGASLKKFNFKEHIDYREAEREYPFKGLISCLRGTDSVGAVRLDDKAFMNDAAEKQAIPKTTEIILPKAENSFDVRKFCMGDQITETFADWMAAECLPEYMKENHPKLTPQQFQNGYKNVFRPFCENAKSTAFDVHPSYDRRANRLLITNPEVRGQMGCNGPHPKYHYCSAEPGGSPAPVSPQTQDGGQHR